MLSIRRLLKVDPHLPDTFPRHKLYVDAATCIAFMVKPMVTCYKVFEQVARLLKHFSKTPEGLTYAFRFPSQCEARLPPRDPLDSGLPVEMPVEMTSLVASCTRLESTTKFMLQTCSNKDLSLASCGGLKACSWSSGR